jgi:hypothetical protein
MFLLNIFRHQKQSGKDSNHESEERYMINEDELDRLNSRISNVEIFHHIQNASKNTKDAEMRLEHCCYVQSVGKVSNYGTIASSPENFQSEDVEKHLHSAILYANVKELMQNREEFAVIEDDFGSSLTQMLTPGKKPSFKNLVKACRQFDEEDIIKLHLMTTETSYQHFLQHNIASDEARSYAFAIAFYTGAYSEMLNLNANIYARRWQRQKATDSARVRVDDNAALIMYYLIKGLSHIKFYWGRVVRYVKLTEQALRDYQPGEILTWLQFSSSDKGNDQCTKHLKYFSERNTKFIIQSLTGRSIQTFSNCAKDEDEVLFLPHSTFLVCHREIKNRKNIIYMRQVIEQQNKSIRFSELIFDFRLNWVFANTPFCGLTIIYLMIGGKIKHTWKKRVQWAHKSMYTSYRSQTQSQHCRFFVHRSEND